MPLRRDGLLVGTQRLCSKMCSKGFLKSLRNEDGDDRSVRLIDDASRSLRDYLVRNFPRQIPEALPMPPRSCSGSTDPPWSKIDDAAVDAAPWMPRRRNGARRRKPRTIRSKGKQNRWRCASSDDGGDGDDEDNNSRHCRCGDDRCWMQPSSEDCTADTRARSKKTPESFSTPWEIFLSTAKLGKDCEKRKRRRTYRYSTSKPERSCSIDSSTW